MSFADLVAALRQIEALRDVGRDPPNFHFRSRPFLHFHVGDAGIFADVRFGGGDFEPVSASTPEERRQLLERVHKHVTRIERARKTGRRRETTS
jgi:hypothetical protein